MNALIPDNTSYSLTNGESRLMISLEVKCLSGLSSSTTLSRERGEGGRGGEWRGRKGEEGRRRGGRRRGEDGRRRERRGGRGGGERERGEGRIIVRLNITEHF